MLPKLSPAAQLFWGSIIRHLLTAISGVLVAHGYVSTSGANAYIEELVGLALYAAVNIWANRVTYWEQIRKLVARTMPASTTDTAVNAKVTELTVAKALPSVFTPADVVPSLVKV
jgi:hypothetical protein